jgi:hypothetical protein
MSCDLTNANARIAARKGHTVDLNIDFLNNGQLKDPYAIRSVQIFKTQVAPSNLVATIPIVDPSDHLYPSPLCMEYISGSTGDVLEGRYHLPFSIPTDFQAPDIYFDVWTYFPTDPCIGVVGCNIDDPDLDVYLQTECHRFWVYPDDWFSSDKLQSIRFGFEPLDNKFNYPEYRPLEIGLMPLPLYDYNFNLVNPMIPYLKPTISIETRFNELLVDDEPCRIGLRQGAYRSNPYVVTYDLDTARFLKGTYQYAITLKLPDGTTRVSRKFIFSIN